MKKIKNIFKTIWSTYRETMYLVYAPYYMKREV